MHIFSNQDDLDTEEKHVLRHMYEAMAHEGVGLKMYEKDEILNLQQEEFDLTFELSGTSLNAASPENSSSILANSSSTDADN